MIYQVNDTQPCPALHIRNATLRYGQQAVFSNLDCSIPLGQWSCLLGPSGVGKSSLLYLLADIIPKQRQTQMQATISCDADWIVRENLAYMGQDDLLLPWLSVFDNVLLGASLRGANKSSIARRARSLLAEVGLRDVIERRPAALSGGMRQRVALVRTLIEDRPIVLMDEPFSKLDAITRLRLQEIAARLLKDKTVLLVTHDPLEALRLADNVLIMKGRPAKLKAPLHLNGEKPRNIQDTELLHLQAQLLECLRNG